MRARFASTDEPADLGVPIDRIIAADVTNGEPDTQASWWPSEVFRPESDIDLDGINHRERTVGAHEAEARVIRLRVAARALAIAQAELLVASFAVADLCEDPLHDEMEVAAVLAWTSRHAGTELGWGRNCAARLPQVFAAWVAGDIDRHRASIFEELLGPLSKTHPVEADAIADRLLPMAAALTGTQLRQRLRRAILAVDPDALTARAAGTHAERGIFVQPADDGATATLSIFHVHADRAMAAYERVDAIARGLRRAGDPRTLDQIRADTVLDLIDGTHPLAVGPIHRRGVVELTIPLATALDRSLEPGELAGYGPVLADIARQIAAQQHDAQWRFSVTHQGQLIYQGTTRARPTPAITESAGTGRPDPTYTTAPDVSRSGAGEGEGEATVPAAPTTGMAGAGGANETNPSSTTGGTVASPSRADAAQPRRRRSGENDPSGQSYNTRGAELSDTYARDFDDGLSSDAPFMTGGRSTTPIPHPPVELDPTIRIPGATLKRWIRMRDRTCRAPGCMAPAYACEIDHTIEHQNLGATCACNLGPLCRHHHPARHNGYWTLVQPSPGVFIWITRYGQIYRRID